MLKYIPLLIRKKNINLFQNNSQTKNPFYNSSRFSFCFDFNSSLNKIKNSLNNNCTDEAFQQLKILISNYDDTKINFEEFKKVLYNLNLEFLKHDKSENFENLFTILMTTLDNNKNEIKSVKMQVNLALFYFNELFQIDSGHIIKKCIKKINSLLEKEKKNENKENSDSLLILRSECYLNLLKIKVIKKGESSGIVKELDNIVEEFEKHKKQIHNTIKNSNEITKFEYTIGDFYLFLNQYEKALIHLNKLKNVHPNILSEIIPEAMLYSKYALCHSQLNQIEMTIFYLNKNISELEKSIEERNGAERKNFSLSLRMNEFTQKMSHPLQSMYYELATNYDQLTNLYLRENKLDICKELGMKAVDMYKKSNCHEILTININFNLCSLHYIKEEFEECVYYGEIFLNLVQQLSILKDSNNKIIHDLIQVNLNFSMIEPHVIEVNTYIANSYFDMENLEKSKFYASQLLKLTKDKFLPIDLQSFSVLNQAAQINLLVTNYIEALEIYDLILSKFMDENHLENYSELAENMVEILYGKAEALFQLQSAQQSKDTYLELLNFAMKYDLEIYDEKRKLINERIDQLDFVMNN